MPENRALSFLYELRDFSPTPRRYSGGTISRKAFVKDAIEASGSPKGSGFDRRTHLGRLLCHRRTGTLCPFILHHSARDSRKSGAEESRDPCLSLTSISASLRASQDARVHAACSLVPEIAGLPQARAASSSPETEGSSDTG
jgi:hypothetical protein